MWNFKKIKQLILDALFPSFCLGCKKEGSLLCQNCINSLIIFRAPICVKCRKRIYPEQSIKKCHKETCCDLVFSATTYSNTLIKEVVHKYKYKNIKELADFLGNLMTESLSDFLSKKNFEERNNFVIVPVPLHPKKERSRGFNQAFYLAKKISENFKLNLDVHLLYRIKNTSSQASSENRNLRFENMRDAFYAMPSENLKNKIVILVDDVFTTGATLEACAKTLKRAGVKKVIGATVAY